MSYADFLAAKQRRHDPIGRDIIIADVHPMLHPWQRHIVRWACRQGRAAIFADCGLGKTFMQLEWARLMADTALIVAPLSVARQTAREATKLGIEVRYVRDPGDVTEPGIWITNYEMVAQFDPDAFEQAALLRQGLGVPTVGAAVTAYQLDPMDRLDDGGLIVPWPKVGRVGQIIDVEIGDRLTRARVRWPRTAYTIADEVQP